MASDLVKIVVDAVTAMRAKGRRGPYVVMINPALHESGLIHRAYDGPESWLTVLQRIKLIDGVVDHQFSTKVKRVGLASR